MTGIVCNSVGQFTLGEVVVYAVSGSTSAAVSGAGFLVHSPVSFFSIGFASGIDSTVNSGAGPDVAAIPCRHEAKTDAHTGANITNVPSGWVSATNIQSALDAIIPQVDNNLYTIGTNAAYATFADAKAQALLDANEEAVFVLFEDLTEDIVLPEGMTLMSYIQQGFSPIQLTGTISADEVAGQTNAKVIGLRLIGNGTDPIITSDTSGENLELNECTLAQGSDFTIMTSSDGGVTFNNCQFISTAASNPGFDISGGNIVMNECGSLFTIGNGTFADISGGALTAIQTGMGGQIVTSSTGVFDFDSCTVSVSSGPCIEHNGSDSYLIKSWLFDATSDEDVIEGSGQINYSDIIFNGSSFGIASTVDWRPYLKAPTSFTPSVLSLEAGDTIDFGRWDKIRVQGDSGPVVLTSTPNIRTDNIPDGQELLLVGSSNSDPVTLQDEVNFPGSGLRLQNEQNMTLCLKHNIKLVYMKEYNEWVEMSRSHVECSSGYGYYGCGCLGGDLL